MRTLKDIGSIGTFHRGRDSAALMLGDGLALLAIMAAVDWILFGKVAIRYSMLLIPAWWIVSWTTGVLPGWGMGGVDRLRRIQQGLAVLFGGASLVLFLGRIAPVSSRAGFLLTYLGSVIALPAVHWGLRRFMSSRGKWGVPAIIYGDSEHAQRVHDLLIREPALGYRPVECVPPDKTPTRLAPMAIVAAPYGWNAEMTQWMDGWLERHRNIMLVSDLMDSPSLWLSPRDLQGFLGLEIAANLLNPWARGRKRAMELALVVITFPLWLLVGGLSAACVVMSDGHTPWFRQERVRRKGQTFRTLKLRTMVPDAEARLKLILTEDTHIHKQWYESRKISLDPRVTPVGRILRRWSLDEIPQLWNVLRGEMALVGPRPIPPDHYNELSEAARVLRERVRPGLTGMWQIMGRSELGTKGMEKWDSYYVRNWSVWLDLYIVIRTIGALISGRGAY